MKSKVKEGGLRTKGVVKATNINKPLVSIITPVFNGVRYIEKTIQSVIYQDYSNIEYIIVDGGSSDGTLDVIKKYDDKIDYWISESDKGPYYAMHKGIDFSTGYIFGIINADDYYEQNVIGKIVEVFKENSKIRVVHGGLNVIDNNGNVEKYVKGDHNRLHKGMTMSHPTVFMQLDTYFEIGGFDFNYEIAADRDLMMRLHQKGVGFYNVGFLVAYFRRGGISDGMSKKRVKDAKLLYKRYKLSMFRYYFVYYILPFFGSFFIKGR